MAGVFVIFASLIGFAGSVTFWALGTGVLAAVLLGYGFAALASCALVLRQARRGGRASTEDYGAYRNAEPLRAETRVIAARH